MRYMAGSQPEKVVDLRVGHFAIEALKESRKTKKASIDELWAAAKVCRVANIMRPYVESL